MTHTLLTILLTAAPADGAAPLNIEGLISDLAFILILAAATTVLFKWLRQPVVLGYIVAGFLASPRFEYLPSVTTEGNIDFWAQIGIVVLLFSLGLEFSFKKLVNAGGSAVVTAMIIILGMLCTGWGIGHLMGFSNINSIFLGGMLSMSSTTIIIKALSDLGLKHKKFATQVLAVLVVEDLFAVLLMVVLSSVAINNAVEGSELLYSVTKLVFFLIMWFMVGVYVLPSLLNGIRRYLNSETLLIISMGLCLGMAVFSVMCGFSLALGAFVMGSILAGTSFAENIDRLVTPVKDLFGAVFFISVGMMVDPHIIVEYWSPILILSGVVIVGMITFGTFGMLVTGQTLLVSLEAGFSLTQIGEFSFIIATLGMSLGVLESSIYPIVVAVSVITTFLTPYFIRMAEPAYGVLNRLLPAKLTMLLDRYASRASNRDGYRAELWVTILKRYLWRIVIYSVLLVAIVLIALNIVLPWMTQLMPSWGRFLCCVLTLSAMAPFLVALTYRTSKKSERQELLKRHARYDVPLTVMYIFRFIIAWGFLVYFLSGIYNIGIASIVAIAVFILLFMVLSTKVKHRLHDMEAKFINNLNERELRRSGKNNNLVNDMHLAYVEMGSGCPFVGERIAEADIRKRYGVNIVSIQRDNEYIAVPRGDMRLFPGDVIGVVGTEDRIQQMLPVVEAHTDSTQSHNGPHIDPANVRLTSIVLGGHSPLLGRTVATGGLRERYGALLVGLRRNNDFIDLHGDLSFMEGDILWLVGDTDLLNTLR